MCERVGWNGAHRVVARLALSRFQSKRITLLLMMLEYQNVRLVPHEPHRFSCLPDRKKLEFYTRISIGAFAWRSL